MGELSLASMNVGSHPFTSLLPRFVRCYHLNRRYKRLGSRDQERLVSWPYSERWCGCGADHPTRKAVAKSTSITSTFLGRRRYSVCGGLDETAAASGPHGVVNDHEIHTAATLSEDGRNDKTYYLHLVQVPGHLVTASDAGRPERQSLRKQSTKYMIPKTI